MSNGRKRAVFMGSPEFAVPCLEVVHEHCDVPLVVSQPDRPAGRGRKMMPPAVKVAAERLGLPVLQPERLRKRSVREVLEAQQADVFVVVAFGQILSKRTLAIPPLGCINVHGSLLPKLRGAAPIQWAVLDGHKQSGVTIMQMDAGVDTGDMLLKRSLELAADETAGSLHDRLSDLGASLLAEALPKFFRGELTPEPQDDEAATHARMLSKADGQVDFGWPAERVSSWIRGMDPWPGAYVREADGKGAIKLFGASADGESAEAGVVVTVDDRGALIGCGEGSVWIRELQWPGRKRLSASALAAGRKLTPGARLV